MVLEVEDATEVVEASPDHSKRVRMASPKVMQVVPPMEVEEEEATQAEELQVEGTPVRDSQVESDQAEELQVEGTSQMGKYSLDMRERLLLKKQ